MSLVTRFWVNTDGIAVVSKEVSFEACSSS